MDSSFILPIVGGVVLGALFVHLLLLTRGFIKLDKELKAFGEYLVARDTKLMEVLEHKETEILQRVTQTQHAISAKLIRDIQKGDTI